MKWPEQLAGGHPERRLETTPELTQTPPADIPAGFYAATDTATIAGDAIDISIFSDVDQLIIRGLAAASAERPLHRNDIRELTQFPSATARKVRAQRFVKSVRQSGVERSKHLVLARYLHEDNVGNYWFDTLDHSTDDSLVVDNEGLLWPQVPDEFNAGTIIQSDGAPIGVTPDRLRLYDQHVPLRPDELIIMHTLARAGGTMSLAKMHAAIEQHGLDIAKPGALVRIRKLGTELMAGARGLVWDSPAKIAQAADVPIRARVISPVFPEFSNDRSSVKYNSALEQRRVPTYQEKKTGDAQMVFDLHGHEVDITYIGRRWRDMVRHLLRDANPEGSWHYGSRLYDLYAGATEEQRIEAHRKFRGALNKQDTPENLILKPLFMDDQSYTDHGIRLIAPKDRNKVPRLVTSPQRSTRPSQAARPKGPSAHERLAARRKRRDWA